MKHISKCSQLQTLNQHHLLHAARNLVR